MDKRAGKLYGVEFDSGAYWRFVERDAGCVPRDHLLQDDFFRVIPGDVPLVDAVVGNPPFIRYQRFTGDSRRRALRRAREAGVELSALTSSWAPFLVHAARFVKPGGRLAMVVPAELAHAACAKPVVSYLYRSFRTIRILSFSRRLFGNLSEDTVLVLASGRCEPFAGLSLLNLPDAASLRDYLDPDRDLPQGTPIDARSLVAGRERLFHYALPDRTRALYRELRGSGRVAPLGALADVGVGYVTGDNGFFHVARETVSKYGLPEPFLRPAVRGGAELKGLRFTQSDWRTLEASNGANWLLHVNGSQPIPEPVRGYLDEGARKGIPNRYKCRVRTPWYGVPHVYEPDAFLTYMNGGTPKLVANEAAAVAPNTLLAALLLCPSGSTLAGYATCTTSVTRTHQSVHPNGRFRKRSSDSFLWTGLLTQLAARFSMGDRTFVRGAVRVGLDLAAVSRQIDAMGTPLAAAQALMGQRLRAALAVVHECALTTEALRARVEEQQRLARFLPLAVPLEPLHRVAPAPPPPAELDVLAVDGSQIDVDRHGFFPCYLINIGVIRLAYGVAAEAELTSTPYLHFEDRDLYIADPANPLRREPVAGALLHARRNVIEMRELARAARALPPGRPAVALVDNSLVPWGLAGRRFEDYVKNALLGEYLGYLREIEAANRTRELPLAGYISRPDGAQVINTLRLAVCQPATCRHCLSRFAPEGSGCQQLVGLRDRDLFGRLLRAPGQRSALFESQSPAARELPAGNEVYFFYLHTGEEIARVEVPHWVALHPQRLDLLHAALAQQVAHGQGYPQALLEAHEQAVVGGADREQFWYLIEQMLAERRLAAETSAKALSKRTRST